MVDKIENTDFVSKVNKNEEIKFYPWDCPSIIENILDEIYKDFNLRKKLIEYCKNSFLKVYPGISRFSSDNFDAVKAWICGVQIAAMNIQSLNCDQMLINKVFFRRNKNCGLVLKPRFLRSDYKLDMNKNNISENYIYERNYSKPLLNLKIDVINCLNLHNCCEENMKNKNEIIYFESFIIGSSEDDKMNTKFRSRNYERNYLNCLFKNETILFNVYETELSFWILKIYVSSQIVARACVPISIMNEGLRTVPCYDKNLIELEDCVLIVKVEKSNYLDKV